MIRRIGRLLLAMTALILACLALLHVSILGIKYDHQEVVVALLGLLALDTLVEKIGFLESIDKKLGDLLKMNDGQAIPSFYFRRDRPDFYRHLSEARKKIWIVGGSLDAIATHRDVLEGKLQDGCEVRVLVLSPELDSVKLAADHFVASAFRTETDDQVRLAAQRVLENASRLGSLADVGGKFEQRVASKVIWLGGILYDWDTASGFADIQLYLYRTDIWKAPMLRIHRDGSPEIFSSLMLHFEHLWRDAVPFQAR